jgi:hypothetical protein
MFRFNISIPGYPLMVLRFTTDIHGQVNVYFFLDRQTTRARRRYAYNPRVLILNTPIFEPVRRVQIYHQQNGVLQLTRLNPRDVRLERDMTRFLGHVLFVTVYQGDHFNVHYDDLRNVTIAGIQHIRWISMILSRD